MRPGFPIGQPSALRKMNGLGCSSLSSPFCLPLSFRYSRQKHPIPLLPFPSPLPVCEPWGPVEGILSVKMVKRGEREEKSVTEN